MRLLPALLAASLAGNAAGALAWWRQPATTAPAPAPAAKAGATATPAASTPWSALASDDPRSLAERLRAAGFPPEVIRAVVQARVSARYDAEMRALARRTQEELPYWQPRSYSHGTQARISETWSRLVAERGRALRDALAAAGLLTAGDEASAAQRRQYGELPAGKIPLVDRINADYAELRSQLRDSTRGITLPADLAAAALLEKERRRDLAAVLSPAELEDHLLRTSPLTERLRTTLTLMDASEAEFRTISAAYSPYAETLFPTLPSSNPGPDTFQKRQEASAAIAAQLRSALGPERAAGFERANHPEFQTLSRMTAGSGLPGEAAIRVFEIRDQAARESMRIVGDGTLNPDQKRAALATLADQARAQVTATIGTQLGNSYLQWTGWLGALSRGMGVQFDGSTTQVRPISGPQVIVPAGGSATVITTQAPGTPAGPTTTTRTTTIRVEATPPPR